MVDTLYAFRADSADNWATKNPLVPVGVPCFEVDTGFFKIGTGVLLYLDLPYYSGSTDLASGIIDDSDTDGSLVTTYSSQQILSLLQQNLQTAQKYTDDAVAPGGGTPPIATTYQLSDGTWPTARPNATTVLTFGYPGRSDPPGWLSTLVDVYFLRS